MGLTRCAMSAVQNIKEDYKRHGRVVRVVVRLCLAARGVWCLHCGLYGGLSYVYELCRYTWFDVEFATQCVFR